MHIHGFAARSMTFHETPEADPEIEPLVGPRLSTFMPTDEGGPNGPRLRSALELGGAAWVKG